MSTTTFLLLSLLCLGASEAHFRGFRASDGSEFYAKSFVDVLRNAIEHKEMNHVKEMISDSFLFIGCTKNVNKDQVLQTLKNVPAGAQFDFQFKSSHFVDPKKIEYTVAINGLGINLEANFVIVAENSKWILIGGNVPKCPKTLHHHHHHRSLLDSAETLAKSFLAHFQIDIASRDATRIAKRFSASFLLHGCHDVYNKDKVVAMLSSVPAGVQATLEYKSAVFISGGKDVQFNVIATGLGRPSFEIQFVMHMENGDYVLTGEKVLNCPKRRHFHSADSAETLAKSFITGFVADIATRDAAIIGKRFSDSFLLHGCHDVYNKDKAIALFTSVPAGVEAALTFESASFVNGGEDVQFNAMASGLGRPTFEIEFLMRKENGEYVLVGEKVLNCPKLRRFYAALRDSADTIAKTFLSGFQSDLASGDAAKIAKRFSDNFLYHGCKGDYTKAKVLALLASIPKDSKVSMTFQSAEFVNGKDVQYTILASGFGRAAFEAQFILTQESGEYVLIGGKVPTCPKRHYFKNNTDGSDQIAVPFVKHMVDLIATRDQDKIGAIFDDQFVFHGCKRKYDKADAMRMFYTLSPDANISLTFKESKWERNQEAIRFIVVAVGFGTQTFEVSFLAIQKDLEIVLTEGKVVKCP